MDAAVAAEKAVTPVRRRVPRWLLAAVLVAAGITLLVVTRRPRQLLDHARLATPYQLPANDIVYNHRWMPSGRLRLLLLTQSRWMKVIDVDPQTGTLRSSHEFRQATNASWLSLDGLWFVSLSGFAPGRANRTAFSIDDNRQVTARNSALPNRDTHWVWKPGSRAWLEVDVQGGTQVAEYPVTGGNPTVYKLPAPTTIIPFWIDSHDRLVVCRYKSRQGYGAGFEEISLGPHPVTRPLGISLPPGSWFTRATLSPDEQRVVWYVATRDSGADWWRRMTTRFFHRRFQALYFDAEEVWVSDRDGRNMHELGELALPDGNRRIQDVQWNRAGTELTFFCDNRLYAVAVDR